MPEPNSKQVAELVSSHGHLIFRYIVRRSPQIADAEEVYQQTCLTVWQKQKRFDSTREFLPWVYGIAKNHLRNFYRRGKLRNALLDTDVLDQISQRSKEMNYREDYFDALEHCLQKLPQRIQRSLKEYYSGGIAQAVAEELSTTPNAVYKMLSRGRSDLQVCMKSRLKIKGVK